MTDEGRKTKDDKQQTMDDKRWTMTSPVSEVEPSPIADGLSSGSRTWRRRVPLPSLRLRRSERRLLLFVGDLLAMEIALIVALSLRAGIDFNPVVALDLWRWFVALALVWALCALIFDVYDLALAASTYNSVRRGGVAAALAVLVYSLIPYFTPPLQARSLHLLFAVLAVAGVVGWRLAYSLLFVQPWFKQRALVVGAGKAGQTLAEALLSARDDANPYRGTGYDLVGFIDDDADKLGSRVAGVPVLGGHEKLVGFAQSLQVDEIILAITRRQTMSVDLLDSLLHCRELGYRISTMPVLYERLLDRVPVLHLGQDLHLVMPMDETASERVFDAFKRITDIVGALIGLGLMLLILPFIALANRFSSPGPLFYRQRRVGRGGVVFDALKFRSMIPNAEDATGAVWATRDDDRITPAGRFMRRTRIDELPQFLNVLRGEMSLIGPRPERPEFVETLAREIPFYRARHAVRPGITGWAQVRYGYGNTEEDARIKLEYDLYYVVHRNLWLDFMIVFKTISVMLRFQGT